MEGGQRREEARRRGKETHSDSAAARVPEAVVEQFPETLKKHGEPASAQTTLSDYTEKHLDQACMQWYNYEELYSRNVKVTDLLNTMCT